MSGLMMIGVLMGLGPVVDLTPVPSLAGLLLVLSADLIDVERIRIVLRAGWGDALAFVGTVLGTWLLPLDQAIYVGVGISIVLFLRRARMLVTCELVVDEDLRLREAPLDTPDGHCSAIRILHVEGPLFFGAAGELDDALRTLTRNPMVKVVIVRVKRAQGLDLTTASVLADTEQRLQAEGRSLLLEDMGMDTVFGEDLFPTKPGWFVAMNEAIEEAIGRVGDCGDHDCPLAAYVSHRHDVERMAR
jgi:SulP family sulfate permease